MMNASSLDHRTMRVIETPISPFLQNAPILACEETSEAILVDPGDEVEKILEVAKTNNLNIKYIVLTHGHIDHAGGAQELSNILKIQIEGPHIADKFLLDELKKQGQMFGMMSENCSPDRWLDEGDVIKIGDVKLDTYFCPGHTPGHVIFYNKENKLALVGDVLFQGSIGRTDLPGGNHQELLESIKNKLCPLVNDIEFIPGHGPNSTFAQERATNAFVADSILMNN